MDARLVFNKQRVIFTQKTGVQEAVVSKRAVGLQRLSALQICHDRAGAVSLEISHLAYPETSIAVDHNLLRRFIHDPVAGRRKLLEQITAAFNVLELKRAP